MPYDQDLAARIRRVLRRRPNISGRQMFGGLAFMYKGKMCCGIVGRDLMVRILEKDMPSALKHPHVRPMDFTGKPLGGIVYVAPQGVAEGDSFRSWGRQGGGLGERRLWWV